MTTPLVVLGCGFTGTEAARLARAAGREVRASVRDPASVPPLRALGVEAHAFARLDAAALDALVSDGADLLVCFPPDPATDAAVCAALARARRAVYVSSTAVYGAARGRVDEDTALDPREPRAAARLRAEELYRAAGAIAIRAAGIYGPGRGLHVRIARGEFKLPGDGGNVVSRVHVTDLARALLAALERASPGAAYVLADDAPVPQREAVRFLCDALGVAFPPSVPVDAAPETLRHDRAVHNAKIKRELALELTYPTYREGFSACLRADGFVRD